MVLKKAILNCFTLRVPGKNYAAFALCVLSCTSRPPYLCSHYIVIFFPSNLHHSIAPFKGYHLYQLQSFFHLFSTFSINVCEILFSSALSHVFFVHFASFLCWRTEDTYCKLLFLSSIDNFCLNRVRVLLFCTNRYPIIHPAAFTETDDWLIEFCPLYSRCFGTTLLNKFRAAIWLLHYFLWLIRVRVCTFMTYCVTLIQHACMHALWYTNPRICPCVGVIAAGRSAVANQRGLKTYYN